MKTVIQRVLEAKVEVDNICIGSIKKGYLIFLGIGREDNEAVVERFVDKIIKLRIFEDSQGKTNLALKEVQGEVLVVSQFTLYADARKQNRPSFTNAADPVKANTLYEYFLNCMETRLGKVEAGKFGADMKVTLTNDGPFTIILDEDN